MALKKNELGAKGEDLAIRYLKKRGYRIIERNYRVKLGEIDIIAEHGDDLVFIEVKTRSDTSFGSPFESITKQKQKKLSKVALEYIGKKKCHQSPARFDVVGIQFQKGSKSFRDATIELLQNAFDLCYGN
ncbi:YraN family protein [Thermodesulfobacteriota bacterium]